MDSSIVSAYILQVIVGMFICFVIKHCWDRRHFYLLALRLPGISIIYQVVEFFTSLKNGNFDGRKLAQKLIQELCVDKNPKKVWAGLNLYVFIIDPEDVKIVLNSFDCINKSQLIYGTLKDAFLNSIIVKPGYIWKIQRKNFSPFFSKHVCENHVEVFNNISESFIKILEEKTQWSEEDLDKFIERLTLDFFMKVITKTNYLNFDEYDSISRSIFRILDIAFRRIFKFWRMNDFIFTFSKYHKEFKQNIDEFRRLNMKIIQLRLEERKKNSKNQLRPECYLDLLLDMYEEGKMDINELLGELQTMMIGAFETTNATIKNIITVLAIHKDVQQKMYEEAKDIFQDTERPVNINDIRKMVYLDMVVKETLRVFNTLAYTGRVSTKDIKLTDYVIPKGCNIVISPLIMHQNPRYWPDPKTFNPDRFSSENAINRHPYTYIAFSGGIRNCIGNRFEMNLLRTLISKLVYKFSFHTDAKMSDVTESFAVILKWSCNKPFTITPRSNTQYL